MPVRIYTIQFAERPYSIVSWRIVFPSVFVNVVRAYCRFYNVFY